MPEGLDSAGIKSSLAITAVWVQFRESACRRVVVACPVMMVFSRYPGFFQKAIQQNTTICAFENIIFKSMTCHTEVWVNTIDPMLILSMSTLFAILSASFGHIALW